MFRYLKRESSIKQLSIIRVDELKMRKFLQSVSNEGIEEENDVIVITFDASGFASEEFDEFADSHSRGESMRIHDHIRNNPIFREWHILL